MSEFERMWEHVDFYYKHRRPTDAEADERLAVVLAREEPALADLRGWLELWGAGEAAWPPSLEGLLPAWSAFLAADELDLPGVPRSVTPFLLRPGSSLDVRTARRLYVVEAFSFYVKVVLTAYDPTCRWVVYRAKPRSNEYDDGKVCLEIGGFATNLLSQLLVSFIRSRGAPEASGDRLRSVVRFSLEGLGFDPDRPGAAQGPVRGGQSSAKGGRLLSLRRGPRLRATPLRVLLEDLGADLLVASGRVEGLEDEELLRPIDAAAFLRALQTAGVVVDVQDDDGTGGGGVAGAGTVTLDGAVWAFEVGFAQDGTARSVALEPLETEPVASARALIKACRRAAEAASAVLVRPDAVED